MAIPVPENLVDFIRSGSKFLVAGHADPDADCIGSSLVLCSALKQLGKEAVPCSAGPFKRAEAAARAAQFTAVPDAASKNGVRLIVVDCSSLERTGDLEAHLKGLPAAFIDHHKLHITLPPETAAVSFIDPSAPSVTFMILALTEALGLALSTEEAELLFLGLCTDTGFFRHADTTSAQTFTAAAKLVELGASPKKTFQMMYGGRSFESRVFAGLVLSRARIFFAGKLIVSYETYEDICQFGVENRDSDAVYQMLQSTGGVEAVAIIRQKTPEKCEIGLRSREAVDVAAIASVFGGGGHKNAAGCGIEGDISNATEKIIDRFGTVFC